MKNKKTPLEELKGNKNILKFQTEEDKVFTRKIVSIMSQSLDQLPTNDLFNDLPDYKMDFGIE